MNSIRLAALTSPLNQDEVENWMLNFKLRQLRRPLLPKDSAHRSNGMQRVIGDGMVGRRCDVNQGSRSGNSDGVHGLWSRSEEPCPEGDRASVRVKKRGNARGAKGGRDVEAEEQRLRPRKAGIVPARAVRARDRVPPGPRDVCLPLDARRRTKAALSDNVLIRRSDGRS